MSATVGRLMKAHELAWAALKPAIQVAIVQAEQAEYEAARASNLAQCSVEPAYPPLVVALAESVLGPAPGPWSNWPPNCSEDASECCASGSCEVCKR